MIANPRFALGLTLCSLLLAGCTADPVAQSADGVASERADPRYSVEIRWTQYGIPHVKANDWGSLGYGFAYATATDAICVIAKDVQKVNGELSRHFGPDEGRLQSDLFHRSVLTDARVARFDAAQSAESRAQAEGYVAGYNRFLKDAADQLPASCRNAPWVRPIKAADVTRLALGVGIRYGLGRFEEQIANAAPPDGGDDGVVSAPARWSLPAGLGSNAVALGKELTASGRGLLLGNPHYPWHGPSRFHLIHTTIPGQLDVMGVSLLNTNRVSIGFNRDVAWTHTVSTALRFTLYQLELNPENPLEYRYDGAYRPMEQREVSVALSEGEETRTLYFTHYGPVLESHAAPWTKRTAYALRDAVIDNDHTAETYDALSRAQSTSEVESAIEKQGVYWVNTVAADRFGNAFYADISGTPNVDAALLERCGVSVPGLPDRLVVLDGSRSDCEWRQDAASRVPGALPPSLMPRLTRFDYVTNSNDSYWLSNPEEPLEGYSPIIGAERTERSLRTRAGLTQLAALIERGEQLQSAQVEDLINNQRNFGAELLLDDVLAICAAAPRLAELCAVLERWDRTMTVGSVGSHVWREFWGQAREIEDLYAVAFDPADPVRTPRGINRKQTEVTEAVLAALDHAAKTLAEAGIALDAPLKSIQFAERNGKKIPVPGGEGWAGMFSMIRADLKPGLGYSPIRHGNSYMQVIGWNEQGTLVPRGMLTYSQSPEPDSPHYSDLTALYARGEWIDLPFTDAQIEADPALRRLQLSE